MSFLSRALRVRNLYLSIYFTVVAVLLVFALIAGVLVNRHAEAERVRFESAVSERTAAWAELIEKGLPGASAPEIVQREALLDWARRLRLALALEAPDGHRIGVSDPFGEFDRRADEPGLRRARVTLADGRVLLIARVRPSWRHGPPPGLAPGLGAPPGPGPGPVDGMRLVGRTWLDEGTTVIALLAALFVAVAGGSYPVVRRLTRRLEGLKHGVEAFGAGQLSHRVPEDGSDEVAALATSFNQAAQRIEGLLRANRSLLANASHELRSPLARLKMAVAMLDSASAGDRGALRSEIDRDIRELDALVEEVLLASRLDAQVGIADERLDLPALAAEEAARVDATLEVGPDSASWALHGDERLLRRAVRNLLENARRYGGDEVQVQLRGDAAAQRVMLAVCDRGPGVPVAERERIFEPFYRLPGHHEQAGGVGLGLSLVRQIAARHGGQAWCEPREGGGSCFVLALPRRTSLR
ncbi:MAG: ATP-binding protein [Burkholderiales bacterium]